MLSYHGWSLEKSSVQQLTTYIFRATKTKMCFHQHFHSKIFLMVFPIFKTLCTQKQAGTNHVFYLVTPHKIKVVISKIIDKGPVPKKAKVASSTS